MLVGIFKAEKTTHMMSVFPTSCVAKDSTIPLSYGSSGCATSIYNLQSHNEHAITLDTDESCTHWHALLKSRLDSARPIYTAVFDIPQPAGEGNPYWFFDTFPQFAILESHLFTDCWVIVFREGTVLESATKHPTHTHDCTYGGVLITKDTAEQKEQEPEQKTLEEFFDQAIDLNAVKPPEAYDISDAPTSEDEDEPEEDEEQEDEEDEEAEEPAETPEEDNSVFADLDHSPGPACDKCPALSSKQPACLKSPLQVDVSATYHIAPFCHTKLKTLYKAYVSFHNSTHMQESAIGKGHPCFKCTNLSYLPKEVKFYCNCKNQATLDECKVALSTWKNSKG